MRQNRTLALKRETLTELSTTEMSAVAGASHLCGVTEACTDPLTHGASLDQTCPTLPVYECVVVDPQSLAPRCIFATFDGC